MDTRGPRIGNAGCALFDEESEVTACPALTMPPAGDDSGDAAEHYVLSDGEADGESDDEDDESGPEDGNDNEFWYGNDDEFDDSHHGPRDIPP